MGILFLRKNTGLGQTSVTLGKIHYKSSTRHEISSLETALRTALGKTVKKQTVKEEYLPVR